MSTINLVSFDVPYPPNYGGIINIFNTIRWLKKSNIEVLLHCFEYDNNPQTLELQKYCKEVIYYSRTKSIIQIFSKTPFITLSRKNDTLLKNLLTNDFPILFEGIHCCYYIDNEHLNSRKKILRVHNIEWQYYLELSKQESNLLKKAFLYLEYFKLKKYESIVQYADLVLSVNYNENSFFKQFNTNVVHFPCLHNNDEINILEGKGNYVLYHGSLNVIENEVAVLWLIENVCSKLPHISFIIAGKKPSNKLLKIIESIDNVVLKSNLSLKEMDQLIQNAQIIILFSHQNTGIKLKLIDTLFKARFCVANENIVFGTEVENTYFLAHTPSEFINQIEQLFDKELTVEMIEQRKEILQNKFNNQNSIHVLIDVL